MNRFVLHTDPSAAARAHCDKHVVKMIVEEAQMLSTIQRDAGNDHPRLYRPTHRHHPCTVWAAQSRQNYEWAWELYYSLLVEYRVRYDKHHASGRLMRELVNHPGLPDIGLTPFPQAMPEQYHHDDPVTAYRNFYRAEKAYFARWTVRPAPEWWQ